MASAEGYTPRATQLLDRAREALGPIEATATALAESLPAPKTPARKSRRRRRKRRSSAGVPASGENTQVTSEESDGREIATDSTESKTVAET